MPAAGWLWMEPVSLRAHPKAMRAEAAAVALARETGVARFGEVAEIAGLVAFLAGPDANYIQGAILDVDGGWLRAV